jgi:hypothetical protein
MVAIAPRGRGRIERWEGRPSNRQGWSLPSTLRARHGARTEVALKFRQYEQEFYPLMIDLSPPFELTLPARRHFDRIAKRCYQQGRWDVIDVVVEE